MPEGRMLKKKISDSRRVNKLSSDSARLLYTWLIPHLDIEGRFSADPYVVKGNIFPRLKHMTPGKIDKMLLELAEKELIVLYQNDGDRYLQLRRFKDEQILRKDREKPSGIPAPTGIQPSPGPTPGVTPGSTPAQVKLSKDKIREYVLMTNEEIEKLREEMPEDQLEWALDFLNNKIETKGYSYKSHYALFKKGSWLLDEIEKHFKGFKFDPKKYQQIGAHVFGPCKECGKDKELAGWDNLICEKCKEGL